MVSARYDEPSGKWHVRIKRPVVSAAGGSEPQYEEFEDTADLLFTGIGGLSRWNWPDIDGLKSFKGTLVHSANWEIPKPSGSGAAEEEGPLKQGWEEDVKDWGDKKVAVIGVVRLQIAFHFGQLAKARCGLHIGLLRDTDCSCPAASRRESVQLRSWQDLACRAVLQWEDGEPAKPEPRVREL